MFVDLSALLAIAVILFGAVLAFWVQRSYTRSRERGRLIFVEQVSFLTLASAELEMLSRMTFRSQRIFANGDAIVFARDRQLPFRRLPSI